MSKTVLLLASMALAVLLAGGVALAANIKGDGLDNVLTGTESRDAINPFDGNDTVYALGGDDVRHSFGDEIITAARATTPSEADEASTRSTTAPEKTCSTAST
jgi:hypothetical protein